MQTIPSTGTARPLSILINTMSDWRCSPKAPAYLVAVAVDDVGGLIGFDNLMQVPHRRASRPARILLSNLPAAARILTTSAFGGWPRLQWSLAMELRISLVIGGPPSKWISVFKLATLVVAVISRSSWNCGWSGESSGALPKKKTATQTGCEKRCFGYGTDTMSSCSIANFPLSRYAHPRWVKGISWGHRRALGVHTTWILFIVHGTNSWICW